MRLASCLSAVALLAVSCVSASQLVSRQSSTGDSKCFTAMCVDATVTGSEVEYVLTSTGARTLGWMAIGWGTRMSGSAMVVLWPNSDGTITLSQRTGNSHVLPSVDSSPSRVAAVLQSASDVTASRPKLAFTLPVDTVGTENIIWAFGTTNPGSSSPSTDFTEHWQSGSSSLDLSKALGSGTSASNPSATGGSGGSSNDGVSFPLTKIDRMIIAHGVLCVLGFLFFLPLGALVARYFRTSTSTWFKAHQTIQSFLAGPIIIVGWALGVALISDGGGPHFFSTHTRLGLALFVLYAVQVFIGNIIHRFKPKSARGRRPFQNYFHVFLGIAIIGLSFYQVRTGYKQEYPRASGRDPLPKSVDIVFYVWAVLLPLLYFGGLALLPKQFSQEAASRSKMNHNTGDAYRQT